MKGFTLLELLISVAMTVVVMAAVYGSYTSNMDAIQMARQNSMVYQTARVIFDRMSRDMESAFLTERLSVNMPETGFVGQDLEIDGRPADRIDFTSLSHVCMTEEDLPSDLCEIGYHLEKDEEGEDLVIFRRDEAAVDADISTGGQPHKLSGMVSGLDISYEDEEGEVFNAWNTLEQENQGRLPALVRVTLTMKDEQGREHTFRTAIHPKLSGMVPK
ncbi:MAG: PilW family protein [Desulfatiglandales bacterium]